MREAVANAVRHAEAKSINISLAAAPDALRLEFINDGAGYPRSGERFGNAAYRSMSGSSWRVVRLIWLAGNGGDQIVDLASDGRAAPVTRVLLADDHPMIRTALEVLLRDTAFEIVGMAETGEETLREIERLQPDILLLDLQMPRGSGMDVLRSTRAKKSKVRIILLTAAIDNSSLLEAKSLKVQGMVLKNSDPAYLLVCLKSVGNGRTWIDPEIGERIKHLAETPSSANRASLAPRERQLIRFVRTGLRNREIAKQLGVTEGTVKVYLHAIFEKLDVSTRTELAIRADEFLADDLLRG